MEDERIRRAAGGDQAAFESLVLEWQKPIYNLTLRMTGNPDDALDLSQETFLRAWRGLPGYRSDASFSTWLHRLASNACIDFLRRRKQEKTVPLTFTGEDDEERTLVLPDPGPDAETKVLIRLDQQQAAEALSRLDAESRHILTLRVLSGLSYAEIAAVLDLPEGTVKSRIARARKKMRGLLKKSGTTSPAHRL